MLILKPQAAFSLFHIHSGHPEFEYLDVRKFAECLQQDFSSNKFGTYKFKRFDYERKSLYKRIPAPCKYCVTEQVFDRYEIEYDKFEMCFDENLIIMHMKYCDEMLKHFPEHKKTLRIKEELKRKNPELFI